MKYLRLILSITVASWMTGIGNLGLAQESNTAPFSITLAPLQYAHVKGNLGKFEALNWMPNGGVEGISNVSFVKDINKNVSLSIEGSEYTNDNGSGELILKNGDIAFLHIDYNAFRKYYDGTGGVDKDTFTYPSTLPAGSNPAKYSTATLPAAFNGVSPNSPDLRMDISYFKLEAGLGPISDPFLDIAYEHNSKDGNKSLLEWTSVFFNPTNSAAYKKTGPAWQSVNSTVDTLTLKEKKEFAGITFKGQQNMDVEYNSSMTYMQYLNDSVVGSKNQLNTVADQPDAKLFGSGIRAEKWMFNDNTFAALGYHYNHTHASDLMERQAYTFPATIGVSQTLLPTNSSTSKWSTAGALQDEHVLVGNFNSNLTSNLNLLMDVKYEHKGTNESSNYDNTNASTAANYMMHLGNHDDQVGEHGALRYTGISHTTLYAETEFQQDRNWVQETYTNVLNYNSTNNFSLERIARTQKESWTLGGRVVPNKFFTFTTQLKQHDKYTGYNTIQDTRATVPLMDSIREKGVDETSTLTWKPYHWLQNSLKYQFSNSVVNPKLSTLVTLADPATENYATTENHMLTSAFTYDITVQPIDPLLLMLTYSHVQNYVRTIAASNAGTVAEGGPSFVPTFNSGSNSWAFSSSYSPLDNLTWNNTVDYTISNNYVDFNYFLPLGSSFKELRYTTGIDWTYHKWLKIGPKYEYISYRDNPLVAAGTYSANIFMLDAQFKW